MIFSLSFPWACCAKLFIIIKKKNSTMRNHWVIHVHCLLSVVLGNMNCTCDTLLFLVLRPQPFHNLTSLTVVVRHRMHIFQPAYSLIFLHPYSVETVHVVMAYVESPSNSLLVLTSMMDWWLEGGVAGERVVCNPGLSTKVIFMAQSKIVCETNLGQTLKSSKFLIDDAGSDCSLADPASDWNACNVLATGCWLPEGNV